MPPNPILIIKAPRVSDLGSGQGSTILYYFFEDLSRKENHYEIHVYTILFLPGCFKAQDLGNLTASTPVSVVVGVLLLCV